MKKNIKNILQFLFFFAILGLTWWAVFQDQNLHSVLFFLSLARIRWILPAIGCVLAYILSESLILHYLMNRLGTRVKFFRCTLFSFIGFFYSAITPSASGGQPMQVLTMRRCGIPTGTSTVVLAIITILYKLVLVLLGLAVLVLRPSGVVSRLDGAEPIVWLGLVLNAIFIVAMLLVVFHPWTIRRLGSWCIQILHRLMPKRDPERLNRRLDNLIRHYSGTAEFFRAHPMIVANMFVITLIQRMFYFAVVWLTYRAFGVSGESPFDMMLLYAMISVAVDMLPLPGGMGASESLFLVFFEPIFGTALIMPGMVLCRGISYYTQLLISGIMTFVAQLILKTDCRDCRKT